MIGVAIVGGLFFVQCVYPFLREDPSETYTCADEEVADFCDDPYTVAGFAAAICGLNSVEFIGSLSRVRVIGGDPGEPEEPGTVDFEAKCPDIHLKWSIPEQEAEDTESVLDYDPQNNQTRLAEELLEQYSFGEISIAEARDSLLNSSR